MTCPFLARIEAGDYLGAVGVAMRGDNPAAPIVAVELLKWGRELVDTGELNMPAGRFTRAEFAHEADE
jgi:hypothetical protein